MSMKNPFQFKVSQLTIGFIASSFFFLKRLGTAGPLRCKEMFALDTLSRELGVFKRIRNLTEDNPNSPRHPSEGRRLSLKLNTHRHRLFTPPAQTALICFLQHEDMNTIVTTCVCDSDTRAGPLPGCCVTLAAVCGSRKCLQCLCSELHGNSVFNLLNHSG